MARGPSPTEPCQARLDELPPDTTCGEDGGYELVEPGGGYFAPPEAPLALISSGPLLALRVARHGRPPHAGKKAGAQSARLDGLFSY